MWSVDGIKIEASKLVGEVVLVLLLLLLCWWLSKTTEKIFLDRLRFGLFNLNFLKFFFYDRL